ncbi:hypothetical protein ICN82_10225, partial [Mangrovicoccus sp. HB182678]|nr:hypothetical protein [Mangrovicoccus algicola]
MSPARSPAAALILAALPAWALLVQPFHPVMLDPGRLARLPPELPVLLLAALALGRHIRWPALAAALALGLLSALKLADFASFSAFARRFDPLGDLHLVPAGFSLLSASAGRAGAAALAVLAACMLTGAAALVFAGLCLWGRAGARLGGAARRGAGAAALAIGLLCLWDAARSGPVLPRAAAPETTR